MNQIIIDYEHKNSTIMNRVIKIFLLGVKK